MKKISVIIPFYNEAGNLPQIYGELVNFWNTIANYELEILFLDNCSTDQSLRCAVDIKNKDPRVRIIHLTRNFGYQSNILTGYHYCTGDAAVQLDADGEDDPQLIAEFIKAWEQGHEVVYGVRKQREEGPLLQLARRIFYRFLNSISSVPLPIDAGDFRLIDRRVIDCLKAMEETHLYLRGMIAFCGFSQFGIPYVRRKRYSGYSKFTLLGYVRFATNAILSFSTRPLEIMTTIGLLISSISFMAGVFYFLLHFFDGTNAPGFTTLAIFISFFAGVQILFLGIVGSYIGRIFEEVKRRPRSISFEVHSEPHKMAVKVI